MTKEQLEELGLNEDQIKEVFKLNGIAVNNAKKDYETKKTEVETLQGQLKTANKEIEGFKELNVDEIQRRANEYKKKFETAETKRKEQLANLEFEHELENAIRDSNAKNVKAVKALIDVESLKESKNQAEDIKQAIESTKSENDYLFGDIEPPGTGGSLGAGEKNIIDGDNSNDASGFIDAIRGVQAKRN